jgi:hypothetical protein
VHVAQGFSSPSDFSRHCDLQLEIFCHPRRVPVTSCAACPHQRFICFPSRSLAPLSVLVRTSSTFSCPRNDFAASTAAQGFVLHRCFDPSSCVVQVLPSFARRLWSLLQGVRPSNPFCCSARQGVNSIVSSCASGRVLYKGGYSSSTLFCAVFLSLAGEAGSRRIKDSRFPSLNCTSAVVF